MKRAVYFPERFSAELLSLKKSGVSINHFILQAVAEKFKRDFNIEIDNTDRRRKGKLYHVK